MNATTERPYKMRVFPLVGDEIFMSQACEMNGCEFEIGGDPYCDGTIGGFDTLRGLPRKDVAAHKWFTAYIHVNTIGEVRKIKGRFWEMLEQIA